MHLKKIFFFKVGQKYKRTVRKKKLSVTESIIIILTIVIQHTKICSQNINFLVNFTLSCYTVIILCENCSKMKVNNLRKNTQSASKQAKSKNKTTFKLWFPDHCNICNAHKTTWSITLLSQPANNYLPSNLTFIWISLSL